MHGMSVNLLREVLLRDVLEEAMAAQNISRSLV